MLNFAEQTGSGAVMLVWSFPQRSQTYKYTTIQLYNYTTIHIQLKNTSFVYYRTSLHKVLVPVHNSCVTELPQHTQQQETWKGGGKQSIPSILHFQDCNKGHAVSFPDTDIENIHKFHEYDGVEWTPDYIAFYHDGKKIEEYKKPDNNDAVVHN